MRSKKSFIIIGVIVAIIMSLSVIGALFVPKINTENTTEQQNYSYGKTENESDGGNKGSQSNLDQKPDDQEVSEPQTYFINKQNSTKVTEISGNTKVFKLSFNLFIKNNAKVDRKFLLAGFVMNYDISSFGTYLSSECKNCNNSLVIGAGEIGEFQFEMKFVINSDNFNSLKANNLDISYFGEKVYEISL